jgi:beta-glucosidase
MKKGIKITLIALGSILLIAIVAGVAGWFYLQSILFNFEKKYADEPVLKTITANGYTTFDRNANGTLDVYEDARQPMEERVKNLLSLMTLEEKIHLLKGSGLSAMMGEDKRLPGAAGTIVPTPRLGIPTVFLSDGPAGLRILPTREGESRTYYATAFPIGTLLASTWNKELVEKVGEAMGNEAKEYGVDVILGPGANIHRHPLCGRNFEYYSEDPVLSGYIGASMVNGIESNGVGASVKHFLANNQETRRTENDVIISERALREIYLKGFEIMVKESQPWTVMSSYNKVNGIYTSEDKRFMTDILRNEWGFQGLVVSDWFGGKNAPAQIKAGNDLLEPGTRKQWDAITEAVEEGTLTLAEIDLAAARILRLVLSSRKMDNQPFTNNPDLKAHAQVTRQSATEGMVLLKNEKALPITSAKNIALIGVTSYDFIAGGIGSGDVNEAYTVSLEQGLTDAGLTINAQAKQAFEAHRQANLEAFTKPEGIYAMLKPYKPFEMSLSNDQLAQIESTADMAIITIGRTSGEGSDRVEKDDFLLSDHEQEMIANTCNIFHAKGKPVVVVLNIGGVIETASWKDQPDAILLAWQGGQESGNSVADILTGKVSPSGKLPMTFPVQLADHASNKNFPLDGEPFNFMAMMSSSGTKSEAEKIKDKDYTRYEEGIYVGYRHFDKANLTVSFPFGYGLSYTRFELSNMKTTVANDTIAIQLTIKNSGERTGKEVIQFYASLPATTIDRPVRELKAFVKTSELQPGESIDITVTIPISELRYWDEATSGWKLEKGTYSIEAAFSSRDIRSTSTIEL